MFLKIINLLEAKQIRPVFCGLSEGTTKAFELAGVLENENCLVLKDLDLALKWVEERLLAERDAQANSTSVTEILQDMLGDRGKAEKLAVTMERVALGKDEYLFRQGDVETCAYLIESGTIEIQLTTESGEIIHLREFRRGSFVGEMAAYSANRKRSASAVAAEPAVLHRVDVTRLKAQNGAESESILHELVARLLVSRLGFMNQRFAADL